MTPEISLSDILPDVWERLEQGASQPAAAFRTGVLATVGSNGSELRTVVLRHFDAEARTICCHTDRRSAKVMQIRHTPRVQWLFFDPASSVQVRVAGEAVAHLEGERVAALWEEAPIQTRHGYLVEAAPGTRTPRHSTGLPAQFRHRYPSAEESECGIENFAVVECRFDRVDWLKLGRYGHARAQFRWRHEKLDATWLIP